ncbi:MAG TPA: hypothetical protein VM470_10165 [Acidimicrobiia bacterium]|nr:hypothetical protein [Acidimicrobiia bacterium]
MNGAAADCEHIIGGFFGQPVNTVTCIGFLVGAAVIWWKRRNAAMALLVAGVGVGSIAFHGPMPLWGEFLHDVTIVWLLIWVILVEINRTRWWRAAFLLGTALSATPVIADPGQAVLAAAVIFTQLRATSSRLPRLSALGLLGTGALVGTFSRTGGPLCHPDSLWQGHGLWHLAAAAALTLWALQIRPAPNVENV